MTEKLIELPYEYNALEPHFDETTMRIHHTKHHQGYVNKLNEVIKGTEWENVPIVEILANLDKVDDGLRKKVTNFGGGVYNHNFFWKILKKDVDPSGEILNAINEKFDCMENFQNEFKTKSIAVFGSGWTWLVLNKNKELEIVQTKNQDSILENEHIPLITLDVWEHAYYLKYQNKRDEFIDNFFKIINWEKVNELFLEGKARA